MGRSQLCHIGRFLKLVFFPISPVSKPLLVSLSVLTMATEMFYQRGGTLMRYYSNKMEWERLTIVWLQ